MTWHEDRGRSSCLVPVRLAGGWRVSVAPRLCVNCRRPLPGAWRPRVCQDCEREVAQAMAMLKGTGRRKRESVRATRARLVPTEQQEMRVLAQWLNNHHILWLHPPNEGARSEAGGYNLKAIGLAPGAPDALILEPPRGKLEPPGAAVEMKRRGREKEAGGGLTDEQQAWLERLAERGWAVRVCYGAGEAIGWLQGLGYGRWTA